MCAQLQQAWAKADKGAADAAVADFFYKERIPLRAIQSPHFKKMLEETGKVVGYKAPTY